MPTSSRLSSLLALLEGAQKECFLCKGPAHEATGWVLDAKKGTILCGRCAKDFAEWYKKRMGQMSTPTKKQKEIAKELGMEPESFAAAAAKSIKGESLGIVDPGPMGTYNGTRGISMKMSTILEAAEKGGGKSFYDHLLDAEEAFLKDAAKLVKKEAGGHAEKVIVTRSRSAIWLEYKGQDRSDMDMEFVAHVVVSGNDATLYTRGTKVSRGSFDEQKTFPLGSLSPNEVLLAFSEKFGR